MKNFKRKIGIVALGIGLVVGGYFIGHHTPKHVTVDKSFMEEFEAMQPGFLDNKISVVKDEHGYITKLVLDHEKGTEFRFMGEWCSIQPYTINLDSIYIREKRGGLLVWHYIPGTLSKDIIEFLKQGKPFDLREMTLKEKILWAKLYEELAR